MYGCFRRLFVWAALRSYRIVQFIHIYITDILPSTVVCVTKQGILVPAKRSQHANATHRGIVGRNMLLAFGHPAATCQLRRVGCCWLKFDHFHT